MKQHYQHSIRRHHKLPSAIDYIIELGDSEGRMYSGSNSLQKQSFVPDHCGVALCRQTAKAMAPIRIPAGDVDLSLPDCVTFLEGYGVKRPDELDVLENWENACAYQSLAVPIGMASSDHVFNFDISEKAYGPHGLVAGTTGSGKSEMVQSWLLSMATQVSPQDVSFSLHTHGCSEVFRHHYREFAHTAIRVLCFHFAFSSVPYIYF